LSDNQKEKELKMFEKLIKKCSQEINSIQKKVINYDNEKLDN